MADQLQQWLFSSDPLQDLDSSLQPSGDVHDELLDDIDGKYTFGKFEGNPCIGY